MKPIVGIALGDLLLDKETGLLSFVPSPEDETHFIENKVDVRFDNENSSLCFSSKWKVTQVDNNSFDVDSCAHFSFCSNHVKVRFYKDRPATLALRVWFTDNSTDPYLQAR